MDHARGRAVLAPHPGALDQARRHAADARRDLDRLPDGDLDERPARHLLAALRVGEADARRPRRRPTRPASAAAGSRRDGRRASAAVAAAGTVPPERAPPAPSPAPGAGRVPLAEDPDHLALGDGPVVVRGRHDRPRLADLDDDDRADAVGQRRPRLAQALDALGEPARAGLVDRRRALEPVALAHERVDDVDLDERAAPDVRDRLRRAHVGEEQVVVVEHDVVPFGDRFGDPSSHTVA